MAERGAPARYGTYWKAWLSLLAVTLVMVLASHPAVLVGGILVKASIIALFFMDLRYERLDFALGMALPILLTGFVLFALIAPDGRAM